MQVAIDTSVLVALFNPRDVWHSQALALQDAMLTSDVTPMYFDCVAAEAISTVARRLREKGRAPEVPEVVELLQALVPHDVITWILPDVPRPYSQALDSSALRPANSILTMRSSRWRAVSGASPPSLALTPTLTRSCG